MQFTIELLSVSKNVVPTAKGSYTVYEVAFKKDGKVEGKKLMSFSAKEVCKVLDTATQGQQFTVTSEKNEKGYWDWKQITSGAVSASASSTQPPTAAVLGKPTPKGDWETREERAQRQVMIVKQSSLAQAVSTLAVGSKSQLDPVNVLALAQTYTDWVLSTQQPLATAAASTDIAEMTDDIPF